MKWSNDKYQQQKLYTFCYLRAALPDEDRKKIRVQKLLDAIDDLFEAIIPEVKDES